MTLFERTALIVVDVQRAFDDPKWGRRNNPNAERNVSELLDGWRSAGRPIIHIRHRNTVPGRLFSPGTPGFEAKPDAASRDGEPILYKSVNSAFIGTDLEDRLCAGGVGEVVVCGITTDHCVSTTTRMAANLGFRATVVSDATATFDRIGHDGRHWSAQDMHDSALASLNNEFAAVQTTARILASLGGARTARAKATSSRAGAATASR